MRVSYKVKGDYDTDIYVIFISTEDDHILERYT